MKRHKRRLIYFILIVLIGGIGCWISGFQHLLGPTKDSGYSFCGNLGTFAISLAVIAFADHLVVAAQAGYKPTKALALLTCAALAVLLGATPLVLKQGWGVAASWVSTGLAGAVWWLVHSQNASLDEPDALAALGGAV